MAAPCSTSYTEHAGSRVPPKPLDVSTTLQGVTFKKKERILKFHGRQKLKVLIC